MRDAVWDVSRRQGNNQSLLDAGQAGTRKCNHNGSVVVFGGGESAAGVG
jgi:hypothetical protein